MTEVETIARTWLGTPFHHQARCFGSGVDCINLVIAVMGEAGYPIPSTLPPYQRVEAANQISRYMGFVTSRLITGLSEYADSIDLEDRAVDDVVVFHLGGQPQHLGLFFGDRIIHASLTDRKVIETLWNDSLENSLGSVWRWRTS